MLISVLLFFTAVVAAEEESLFAPTPMPVVARMLQLAEITEADVLWDLGCGDARIPILASKKYKCRSYGVDIDPVVVAHAESLVRLNDLERLVTISLGDCRETDFGGATVVTLYLMPSLSRQLVSALKALQPGARIVSHAKAIPGWRAPDRVVRLRLRRPDEVYEDHTIYMWVVRSNE